MSGTTQQAPTEDAADGGEWEIVEETKIVPQEVWEDVPIEQVEEQMVPQKKEVAVIKAKYAFQGQGMNMVKGEVIFFVFLI